MRITVRYFFFLMDGISKKIRSGTYDETKIDKNHASQKFYT